MEHILESPSSCVRRGDICVNDGGCVMHSMALYHRWRALKPPPGVPALIIDRGPRLHLIQHILSFLIILSITPFEPHLWSCRPALDAVGSSPRPSCSTTATRRRSSSLPRDQSSSPCPRIFRN